MAETSKAEYFFEFPTTDRYDEDNDVVLKKQVGTVPCTPPWSTWNGRIHCSPDSWVGKVMLADPASMTIPLVFNKYNGESVNSTDDPSYSKGVKAVGKEDWINGKWFAPADWSSISTGDRTPDRKRVPDWVARKRYATLTAL